MNNTIKSALDKVKAEEELINKTKDFLIKNTDVKNYNNQMKIKSGGVIAMKKITIAACLALLIGGVSYGGYNYYNDKTPVAYLSLDINPSIELGINDSNEVVSATSYNEDGETVLEGVDVVDLDVKDAVNELVVSAAEGGFIADDGSTIISVTSETDDVALSEEITSEAEAGVEEAITETEDTAVVYKANVALERRDEARELGITPGKLNLIQKLLALDPTATVEDYKEAKVTNIMKKVVELKKSQKNSDVGTIEDVAEVTEVVDEIEEAVAKVENNNSKKVDKSTVEENVETNDATAADVNSQMKNGKQDKEKEKKMNQGDVKKVGENNADVVSPTEVQPDTSVTNVTESKDTNKKNENEKPSEPVEDKSVKQSNNKTEVSGDTGKVKENNGAANGKSNKK